MPAPRSFRHLCLLGSLAVLVLSVACRLDMLLKSNTALPVLTVSPTDVQDTALAGSEEVRTAEVSITNGGGGSFTWSAAERSGWIRIEPREGEVPGTITITLDPDDLGPGIYQGDVTVVAKTVTDSQVTTIAVTFVVQRPGLNVTPTSIERSTNVGSNEAFNETIQISNSGTGELSWTATRDGFWITLGATSGTGDASLPVTINSAGLDGGTYHGEVVISAPGAMGSPQRVDVTLTVFAPGLAVSPGSIRETATTGSTTRPTSTLRVTNSGNGAITWTASKSQPWLSLSKSSGGAPEDITVTLNPTGLPPAVHRDTIVFTSPEATNGPVKVPVEFEISQPGLVISPGSIDAMAESNDPKKQDFELSVSNSGGGPLAWFASANAPWISLSPMAGIAPSTVKVTVDPQGLSPGTHSGTVTVSSPGALGSPATVPVQLVITAKRCNELQIDPDVVREGTLNSNDCEAPHRPGSLANIYVFSANAGDTVSMRLTASFNAYLIFTDGAGNVLAQNDECPGESGTACITEFPITASGRYMIEATSTAPGATGDLTITVLRERAPTPPQELSQLRDNGNTQIDVGETISKAEVVIRGGVNDPNQTDEIRLEVELQPVSSPFTGAATLLSDFVASGTTTSVRSGTLANNSGYHWQARACDGTGRCSAWVQFGNNAESDADFSVAVPGGSPPRQP